ncbi:MAG: RNA methyltransferase [Candidatus Izemoplasmatales bacterium]|nr:RNA methyltransferase [Candidatus Izemoplasmatales bacterium]
MIIKIESDKNEFIKDVSKLKQKKYRNLTNQYLVEGPHLIKEALQAGVLKKLFFVNDIDFDFVDSYQVSEKVMKKLSSVESLQGIIGVCEKKSQVFLSDKILLLDNVQDPGNIGTLMRSAVAFGFNTIVADSSVDFYNDKVIRSSQGAVMKINLINMNILDFIERNPDYRYFVTDLRSNIFLEDHDLSYNKIGIILGNEGQGVSDDVIRSVSNSLKIRIQDMESLNVGVAGSIIMYEVYKRGIKL